MTPEESLAHDSGRIVVPVVGSLRGANNSVFRTRLTLFNPGDVPMKGRLIFYQTQDIYGGGGLLRYEVPPMRRVVWDDVVLATGSNGLGTLDVLPDETPFGSAAPQVTVEIRSLGAAGGSYGANVPAISMTDFEFGAVWTTIQKPTFYIDDVSTHRHNIGIRSLRDDVTVAAALISSDGTLKKLVERVFTADYHEQILLASFFGTEIASGDIVQFDAERFSGAPGGAIIYLTTTDNVTNDLRIDIPRPAEVVLKQPIFTCSFRFCRNVR